MDFMLRTNHNTSHYGAMIVIVGSLADFLHHKFVQSDTEPSTTSLRRVSEATTSLISRLCAFIFCAAASQNTLRRIKEDGKASKL